jgi:peptidoglycan/xylan/chitin deacetylase (PgdA/CDA1 family)
MVLFSLMAILVTVVMVAIGTRELARSRTYQLFGNLVPRVETQDKIVALTFDDGPNTQYINEILNVLAARSVHATFFVTGAELSTSPEAGRAIVAAGHELGNHTWSHDRMILRSSDFYRKEIDDTDALIRATGQSAEIFFRPPFCYKLVGLPWYLSRQHKTTITWDVEPDSYPGVAASPQGIMAHVAERVRPGSIILLHVWYKSRQTSREAVPLIIDALQTEGYRFVTVGQMLRPNTAKQP